MSDLSATADGHRQTQTACRMTCSIKPAKLRWAKPQLWCRINTKYRFSIWRLEKQKQATPEKSSWGIIYAKSHQFANGILKRNRELACWSVIL
jgi:hypothetical protein